MHASSMGCCVRWLVASGAVATLGGCSGSTFGGASGTGGSQSLSTGGDGATESSGGAASGGATSSDGATNSGGTTSNGGTTNTGGATSGGGSGGTEGSCGGSGPCTTGVCWQGLDGVNTCVSPIKDVPTETCMSFDTACCATESDCTGGNDGRCISNRTTYLGCGGAVPTGNTCHYDDCTVDVDCKSAPAMATVSTCVPSGALGEYNATCVYGGCRTNGDCTLHPGGTCTYGEQATHGMCDRGFVLYCAYPSDPCKSYQDCASTGLVCAPEDNFQGRHCTQAPPAYP